MTSWTEILKANKGLHARDSFSELWGLKLKAARAEFPDYTITGTLPLSFNSRVAGALKNYRMYGDSDGSGVQTENLWDSSPESLIKRAVKDDGSTVNTMVISVPGTYTARCFAKVDSAYSYCYARMYNIPNNTYGQIIYLSTPQSSAVPLQIITAIVDADNIMLIYDPLGTGDFANTVKKFDNVQLCIIEGSTAPTTYIPYGYKIPILNTSGEQQSNYDLFIGSTKLGAEEYVDYGEQKVYKRTENYYDYLNNTPEDGVYLLNDGSTAISIDWKITDYIPIDGQTFTLSKIGGYNPSICLYDANKQFIIGKPYRTDGASDRRDVTISSEIVAKYARFSFNKSTADLSTIMLVPGSTAPQSYIPYLQPTDPPVPLPAIQAYKGENTLSSTETVGEVSVKGKITEMA